MKKNKKNWLSFFSRIICFTFVLFYAGYALNQFTKNSQALISTKPDIYSYRSDEFIFLRTYYLMREGTDYYTAFRDAVHHDARGMQLTSEMFSWRLPTIFFLWQFFASNGYIIGLFFVLFTSTALLAVERLNAKFLPPPFSLVGPIILVPYFLDSLAYKTSFLFTEWWGWFFFIFGLTFFIYSRKKIAWLCLTLSVLTRELFIIPIVLMFLFALFQKRHRGFFLSILTVFLAAYFVHYTQIQAQNVPAFPGSIFSRVRGIDKQILQSMSAFSMRQYPLLQFKLPIIFMAITLFALSYRLVKNVHKTAELCVSFFLLASVSFIFILPLMGSGFHDYWGIVFMPTVIALSPLFLVVIKRFRTFFSYWPVIGSAASALVFFREILTSDRMFLAADISRQYYPWYVFTAQKIGQRVLPLWSASMQAGYPLFAEGETGALYPILRALFWIYPRMQAFNLLYPIHFFLLQVFTYLFLRSVRCSKFAGFVASLAYSYGLFFVTKIIHPSIIMSAAWFPLGLYAIQMGVFSGRVFFLLLPLTIVNQFLAGHPQVAFISIIAYLIYFSLLVVFGKKEEKLEVKKITLQIIYSITIGLAISAIQLIPLIELGKHSSRPIGDLNYLFSFSLPFSHLLTFIFPDFFGRVTPDKFTGMPWYGGAYWEFALYIGTVPFIFACLILFIKNKTSREWLFIVFMILSLLLAIGGYLFPYRAAVILLSHFLSFPFRVSSRFLLVTTFATATLAAFAIDRFMVFFRKRVSPKLLKSLLLTIVILDLYNIGYSYNKVYNSKEFLLAPRAVTVLNTLQSSRIFTEAKFLPMEESKNTIQPNLNLLFGLDSLAVTSPLPLAPYDRLIRRETYAANLPRLGVTHFLSQELFPELTIVQDDDGVKLYSLNNPWPVVFLTDEFTELAEELQDHSPAVIVEKPPVLEKTEYSIRKLKKEDTRIEVVVSANKRLMLVFLDNYYPGWRVDIDGAQQKMLRVNGLFKGVAVNPGLHTVSFTYMPDSLLLGAIASLLGIFAYVSTAVYFFYTARKEVKNAE